MQLSNSRHPEWKFSMRKILLFITLHLALLAGAQETPASKTNSSSASKSEAPLVIRCGSQMPEPNSILYIVDGFVYQLKGMAEISPEDIRKVDTITGKRALELYGSLAETVIYVTTNRKPGQIVVRDREDHKPLASASLVFNECYQVVNRAAGEDGRVDTKGITPGKTPVEVSCVGYKRKTLLLDITKNSIHEIELERDYDTLQQVVVAAYPITRCWRCYAMICSKLIACNTVPALSAPSVYLKVFPNPAKSNSAIYLQLPSTQNSFLRVELLNSSGQLIKISTLQAGKATNARFDLPQLSAGMYYIRVADTDLRKTYVGNMIVE